MGWVGGWINGEKEGETRQARSNGVTCIAPAQAGGAEGCVLDGDWVGRGGGMGSWRQAHHAQVPCAVDEYVSGLQVSVDDGSRVHVGQGQNQLSRHEADLGGRVGER